MSGQSGVPGGAFRSPARDAPMIGRFRSRIQGRPAPARLG
jgi:hypothetical protein